MAVCHDRGEIGRDVVGSADDGGVPPPAKAKRRVGCASTVDARHGCGDVGVAGPEDPAHQPGVRVCLCAGAVVALVPEVSAGERVARRRHGECDRRPVAAKPVAARPRSRGDGRASRPQDVPGVAHGVQHRCASGRQHVRHPHHVIVELVGSLGTVPHR